MTGYGESRFTLGGVQVVCSARSVNSRFLEVAVYCPEELAWFKPHCEEIVRNRFTRGQIEIAFIPAAPLPSELVFNNDILTQYEKFLAQKLGKKKVVVPPQDYLHIPGFVEKKARDWRSYRSKLDFHLLRALIKMQHARRAEGKRTVRICLTHLRYLNRLLRRIAVLSAQAQKKRVLALRHRIYRDLLGYSRSEADFAAEPTSAAERRLIVQAAQAIWQQRREELVRLVSYDASEEISRIGMHIAGMLGIFRKKESAGRELEFFLQELQREANTLAAKVHDGEASALVVIMKSEIEKLREQVRNLQ